MTIKEWTDTLTRHPFISCMVACPKCGRFFHDDGKTCGNYCESPFWERKH